MKFGLRAAIAASVLLDCPLVGAAAVEATVSIDSSCASTVDVAKKVDRSNNDVLVWRFKNACTRPLKVHVCAKGADPLLDCAGTPPVRIREQFVVHGGVTLTETSAAVCTINWEVLEGYEKCSDVGSVQECPKFYFSVVTARATAENPPCPGAAPQVVAGQRARPLSELALEVEP